VISLAVLCIALSRQTPVLKPTAPVVISVPVAPGRCRVPVDVAGKTYLFLIDTGMEKSYIRADVKANALARDPKAELVLGAGSIPIADLPSQSSTVYLEVPAIAGIVGMDVLSKVAFTIDYDKQQLTVWPENAKQEDMVKGLLQPGQQMASIPLLSEQGYLSLFLQTSLGECELDTGAAVSLLAKAAAKSPEVFQTKLSQPMQLFDGTAGKATQAIVRRMSLGDENLFCQQVLVSDTTDVGVISPNLFGRKVLFDMPGKRVVFAASSPSEQACRTIGALLHGTVEEREGEPFLKAQLVKNLGPGQSPWVRIVSINGHKGSDLLTMLKSKDLLSAVILQKAYDSLATGGKVLIERKGKQESLFVAPYLSAGS
jgi:hypothetical protein